MEIRLATPDCIPAIAEIYGKACGFMRRSGNLHQWSDSYPSAETAMQDIGQGSSYVCLEDGRIVATFFLHIGEEPTYRIIEGGRWLNDDAYGVIHRVASDGTVKGVMHEVLNFCFREIGNIRIDTHRDNKVMQNSLLRYGFRYCGIIRLADGSERLAYQLAR